MLIVISYSIYIGYEFEVCFHRKTAGKTASIFRPFKFVGLLFSWNFELATLSIRVQIKYQFGSSWASQLDWILL